MNSSTGLGDPAAAVILAAGGGSRMGQPKALLRAVDDRSFVHNLASRLGEQCTPCVVVTGAARASVSALLPAGTIEVHNPDWRTTGPVDSLRLALGALPAGVARVVVTPVDVPRVTRRDLGRLLAAKGPAVLCWKGSPGHPALLGLDGIQALLAGDSPPEGLRSLLADAQRIEATDGRVLLNLNTPEQLAAWRSMQADLTAP